MNIFEQMTRSLPPVEEAEVKLDLRGMEKDAALVKLDDIVKHCKKMKSPTLYVFFDPAKPGSGETLFQPVARYFKYEKLNNYVESATPVMTGDNAGLFVRFKM
jgi:hypothetical protein